jgi:hypothetical protein
MTSGITYFGIDVGSSVPPATGAANAVDDVRTAAKVEIMPGTFHPCFLISVPLAVAAVSFS